VNSVIPVRLARRPAISEALGELFPRPGPDAIMHDSPVSMRDATTPRFTELAQRLSERMAALIAIVCDSLTQPLTPAVTFALEKKLRTCCARPGVR